MQGGHVETDFGGKPSWAEGAGSGYAKSRGSSVPGSGEGVGEGQEMEAGKALVCLGA